MIPNSTHTNSITVTLTAGASSGNNFAEVKPAAVSGFIYVDSNNNGVMDSNEPGIAGVTLRLTGSNDLGAIVPLSTVTGADGSFMLNSSTIPTSISGVPAAPTYRRAKRSAMGCESKAGVSHQDARPSCRVVGKACLLTTHTAPR